MTDNNKEYNCAYERVKFWMHNIMHHAVLVQHDDTKIRAWRDTGLRCMDFPIAPVDQALALMLMSKLNAITEGRLEIRQVAVSSAADDFITYTCDSQDVLHWFDSPGWWKDPGPTFSTALKRTTSNQKIISIYREQDWSAHDLAWCGNHDSAGSVTLLPQRDA